MSIVRGMDEARARLVLADADVDDIDALIADVRAEYESLEKASQAVVIARSRGTFDDAINDLAQALAALEQKP